MDTSAKRGVQHVTAEWQMPQIIDALAKALAGQGPALRFAERKNSSLTSVPEDVAVIIATSGSTGAVKEVGLSAQALLASAKAANDYLGAKAGDTWSLLLPLTHIAGVNVLVRSLELGREPVDLRKIRDQNLPNVDFTSIVPTQLHRAVSETGYLLRHLQSAHRVLVGGGPLNEALRKDADAVQVQVTTTYGMSESSGGCVYDGIAFPGLEVEIRRGLIALKGDVLASYYLPTESEPSIRSIRDHEGWFITSDRGAFDGSKLIVLGRNDDVVISGGEKISLDKVEEFLREHITDGDLVAFSTPDPEWGELLAVATTVLVDGERRSQIESKMGATLGRHAIPKRFYFLDEIPRTTLGKVDRDRLRRLTRDGI